MRHWTFDDNPAQSLGFGVPSRDYTEVIARMRATRGPQPERHFAEMDEMWSQEDER